jgi:hypothetical protein
MSIVPLLNVAYSWAVAYWESVPGQKFHFLQGIEAELFLKL